MFLRPRPSARSEPPRSLPRRCYRRLCRSVFPLLAAVLMTGALLGVQAYGQSASASSSGHSGSLTVLEGSAVYGTWPNLDPALDTSAGADVYYLDAIYGDLFEQGPTGQLIPDLATGYAIGDGGLTFTISLRHGVTFSDGTPFNAQAVAFNIRRDLEPQNACLCDENFPVKSITTPGPYTVELNLSSVYAPIKYAFFTEPPNWIASPTALAKMGTKAFGQKPVGAGPFEVASNEPNTKLVLKRNPHYWQKGHPYLRQLTFEVIGNDNSAYDALLAGNAQAYQGYSTLTNINTVRKHVHVATIPAAIGTWNIQFNTTKPPFNNILAREAVYYATNPEPLNKSLLANKGTIVQSATEPEGLYYDPKVPGYRTYNLAKAKALVKQLGGLHFTEDTVSAQSAESMNEELASEWAQAGIHVTLTNETLPALIQTYTKGDWEGELASLGGFDPALGLGLPAYFTSTGPFSGVKDPTLDNMIAKASATVNQATASSLYDQIWKYISEKAYSPFLFVSPAYNLSVSGVSGPGLTTDGWQVFWQDVSAR